MYEIRPFDDCTNTHTYFSSYATAFHRLVFNWVQHRPTGAVNNDRRVRWSGAWSTPMLTYCATIQRERLATETRKVPSSWTIGCTQWNRWVIWPRSCIVLQIIHWRQTSNRRSRRKEQSNKITRGEKIKTQPLLSPLSLAHFILPVPLLLLLHSNITARGGCWDWECCQFGTTHTHPKAHNNKYNNITLFSRAPSTRWKTKDGNIRQWEN